MKRRSSVWCFGGQTHPILSVSGGAAVVELRARGVKTVVIDPRLTPDAAKADVWLPIRPGTDVALMFAWLRYIIENECFDRDFVLKWTNLPYLVDTGDKAACAQRGQPRCRRTGYVYGVGRKFRYDETNGLSVG